MFVFGCQNSFLRKYKRKFLKSSLIAVRQFHIRFVLQRSFFYNVYHAIYLSISHENEDLDKEKQSYMPITIHLVYQKTSMDPTIYRKPQSLCENHVLIKFKISD